MNFMSIDQQPTEINNLSDLIKHSSFSIFLDLPVDKLELNEILDLILSKTTCIENEILRKQKHNEIEKFKIISQVSRFTLFNTSITGVADNLDENWLSILIKNGLCTPELALCLAPRMRYDPFIGGMLRMLAPFLAKSETLVKQAVEAADKVIEMYWRYVALSALVPLLPEPEERINDVLNMAPGFDSETGQVKILTALLPHLPPKQLKSTLKMALKALQEIGSHNHIVRTIIRLLPWLPQASSELQLQTLWKLVDEEFPELSPLLTQNMIVIPNRTTLRRYFAVMAWFGILNGLESQLLAMEEYLYLDKLVPYLPKNLRQACIDEALRLLEEVKSPYHKACGLAQLIPNLSRNQSASLLGKALRSARKEKRKEYRALALIRVSRCMEPVEQAQLIEEALPMIGGLSTGPGILALTELFSIFSLEKTKRYLPQLLAPITELNDEPSRFVATVLLDPRRIDREDKHEMLDKLVKRWYRQAEENRSLEVIKILPYLSSEEQASLIDRVLVETERLSDAYARSYAWRHLLPFISLDKREIFLNQLIETALAIHVSRENAVYGGLVERSQELSSLVCLIPEARREDVMDAALDAMFRLYASWSKEGGFRLMYGSDFFHDYVTNLLPVLSEKSAMNLIRHATPRLLIGDRWRLSALLYPKLAPEDALPTREWLVSQMLEPCPDDKLYTIYSVIRTCTRLAHILTGECKASLVKRALSLANGIETDLFRVRAFLYIVPHLEGEIQQQILQQAFEGMENGLLFIQQKYELLHFAKHITNLPDQIEMWACIRALRLGGNLERHELFVLLEALAPRLRALGGVEMTRELAQAVEEIGEFFT